MLPPHAPRLQRAGIVCFGEVIWAVLRLFMPRVFQNACGRGESLAYARGPGWNNQSEGRAFAFLSAHTHNRCLSFAARPEQPGI